MQRSCTSARSWVKAQQIARPDECWADEARQFLAYVAQLKARGWTQPCHCRRALTPRAAQEEYADVLSEPAQPVAKPPQAFSAPAPAPSPAPALAPVISASASAPFTAAPPPAAAPLFTPPPSAPGGFSFLGAGAPPLGGTNPFLALQPAAAPADEAEGECWLDLSCLRSHSRCLANAEDEPERPPSPSVHKSSAEDDGEQVLFESKCKLFFRDSGDGQVMRTGVANRAYAHLRPGADCLSQATWSPRGVGTLQLRRPLDASAAASARLIVRNDTGKAMLNAKLYAGMKVVVKEGKSVCTTVFNTVVPSTTATGEAEPAAPPDASSKPVMTCVRVAA